MSQGYARALAKVVVAQTAESVGFEGVQQSASDTLADLLLQYISEIGGATHSYAELAGRVECNVNDLLLALQDMGASVDEIMEYTKDVEDVPFAHSIPRFPAQKKPAIFVSFKEKGEEPPAHIPAFLPAFPEKHTYVDTPVFSKHTQDAREQKLAAEKGRRDAEKALLKLAARAQQKEEGQPGARGGEKGMGDAAGNPFLAPPEREEAPREDDAGPSAMDIDSQPGSTAPIGEWQEAGAAAGQLLGSAPLKLDWTQPALPMRTDPSQLGFEDAFANLSEDAAAAGGRNRRLSTQSRGDPESMRAEQILAAGAAAMQMGEGAAQKSKSGR